MLRAPQTGIYKEEWHRKDSTSLLWAVHGKNKDRGHGI
jgi:hypothetical protein